MKTARISGYGVIFFRNKPTLKSSPLGTENISIVISKCVQQR